jgi:hypothetical protein
MGCSYFGKNEVRVPLFLASQSALEQKKRPKKFDLIQYGGMNLIGFILTLSYEFKVKKLQKPA